MIKKIIGGFLVLLGLTGAIVFLDSKEFIDLFLALIFFLIGIKLIKSSKKITSNTRIINTQINNIQTSSTPVSSSNTSNKKTFIFNVAGVTKKNNEGNDIQKLISKLIKDELMHDDPYEGLSNKEILEDCCGERIYEADVYGYDEAELIFEPDNKYDPNAIKVVHEDMGHVGYVPRVDNIKVSKIIKNNEYEVSWKIVGGKYKYVDEYANKVVTEKDSYGIEIELTY